MKKLLGLAVLSAALLAPRVALADPVCTDATTMVTFVGYLNCAGPFGGNIHGDASEDTQLTGLFGGTWTWEGDSSNDGGDPFSNNPPGSSATGTINFKTPISGFFVIGVKQCDFYSFYEFDEATAISSIDIDSRGTCSGAGFSHVALYDGSGLGTGTPQSVTPEPATMTLMATGLVGLVGVGRRRKKA